MNTPTHFTRVWMSWCLVLSWLVAGDLAAGEVRIRKDVPYKASAETEYERERCKLDLYLPQGGKEFATIVWFHGGGLQGGDKAEPSSVAFGQRFASAGIAVASVNYRLSDRVTFPAYVEDAAAAVVFVRGEIAKHGGSPHRVFVSGHSAGGYLTAMIGLDEQYLAKHNLTLRDVAGLIPISGQMITHSTVRQERDIPRTRPIIDHAAPSYHARNDSAPVLSIVGGQDLPTRAEENRYFVAALKAAGHADATYLEVAGRDHGSIGNRLGEANDAVAAAVRAFIERQQRPAP